MKPVHPTKCLPPAPQTLLLRLKTETRPHHERAERTVRLLEPGLTPEGYRRHLEALYGLFAPLEEALADCLSGRVPELRATERWKLPLLEEDLAALGHDAASLARLPRASTLPALTGLPEALGCFYVLEGSTLGGQLILRHLQKHFAGAPVGAFAFFRAYGEEVGPMWKAFGEAVTRVSAAEASESFDARVVRGAQDTFDAFEAWLGREVTDVVADA
ncbi:biliverdin-producing heme oxygenase [Hyalangium rubrum]|uniref:Biliverdin-producing heme oxygenase n=1 Tax=Hyalangium rubrum TaxID=3103134 RepID=A0ABU5H2I2_9BACT|nr:biliverdin-producing heme oxygenase [Hyalangium sp. s54d21]MDY7227099.1 biliverdin-producing heme oxygenase [Hyalangium sp. s54d21]